MFFAASISQAQTNTPKKKSAATGKKKGPTTQAFDPPVFEPEQCTQERATENSGRWLFRSATIQSGGLLKTYWLGRNYEIDPLNPQPPAPPIENNYVGINTSDPSSILDVHIPENVDADPLYGLSVSTGLGCSKVGLVSGDEKPSWVGSYSFDGNGHHPFQVRAGIYGNFWNPSSGTYIHLNPQNERIGINTSTPAATLDVNGDAKADNLKLTQVPEGLVGINGSGFISPATASQLTNLLVTNGEQNYLPKFGAGNGLENSYIRQGIANNIFSIGMGVSSGYQLKDNFHFGETQTLHTDLGGSQFAFNSYSYEVSAGVFVYPKINQNSGASNIVQSASGRINFRNLKSNENSSQWRTGMSLTPDRRVGIGTENPGSLLELQSLSGEASVLTLNTPGTEAKAIQFSNNGSPTWKIEQAAGSADLVIGDGSFGNSIRIIKDGSKVGDYPRVVIGENTVSFGNSGQFGNNIKLTVDGTGVFKEIAVLEPGQWADYVFDKDYKLLSLDSVETFVNQNHHLPDVPSASEVAQNGLKVGEMNAVLLRKIEELTLYIIDLKREVETLKSKKP